MEEDIEAQQLAALDAVLVTAAVAPGSLKEVVEGIPFPGLYPAKPHRLC